MNLTLAQVLHWLFTTPAGLLLCDFVMMVLVGRATVSKVIPFAITLLAVIVIGAFLIHQGQVAGWNTPIPFLPWAGIPSQ